MGVYKKLLVIQQKVNGLGKDKKANSYSYVTGDKVLSEIKPLMNELGLLLKQEIIEIENTKIDYKTGIGTQYEKSKSEILSRVMMRFTWVDTETGETDVNLFGANGQNDWDKGVGSALTYAERYFLLKYFHIATDQDDIDNLNREDTKVPNHIPRIPKPVEATPFVKPELGSLQPSNQFESTIVNTGTGNTGITVNTTATNTLTDKTTVLTSEELAALDKEKRELLLKFVEGKNVPAHQLAAFIINTKYKVEADKLTSPTLLAEFIDNATNVQLKGLQDKVVALTKK